MYSVVLMAATLTAPDVPSFGLTGPGFGCSFWSKHCFFDSCHAARYGWTSCATRGFSYYPGGWGSGCYGGCYGGCGGCYGGCYGGCGGCYGGCYGGCGGCYGGWGGGMAWSGRGYGCGVSCYGGYAFDAPAYGAGYSGFGAYGNFGMYGAMPYGATTTAPLGSMTPTTSATFPTLSSGGLLDMPSFPTTGVPGGPSPSALPTPPAGGPAPPSIPLTPPSPGDLLSPPVPLPKVAVPKAEPGALLVNVPADAKVYVNDVLMKSKSGERLFKTPALEAGETYFYTIRVVTEKAGKEVEEVRKVYVDAGKTTRAEFDAIRERDGGTSLVGGRE